MERMNEKEFNKVRQMLTDKYYKEYREKYTNGQEVEIESNLKLDSPPFGIVLIIFTVILLYSFEFCIAKKLIIEFLICAVLVIALFIFFLAKRQTIKKIILKNNEIELYDSNKVIKIYQLDQVNIRYEKEGPYHYARNEKISIYFNNVRYTSIQYNVYTFDNAYTFAPYIAFERLVSVIKVRKMK